MTETIDLKDLAHKLTSMTWIPRQYFVVGSLLVYNVSFGPDGAQEYKVFKLDPETNSYYEFESLTVSWMKEAKLLALLEKYEATSIDQTMNVWKDRPIKESPMEVVTQDEFERFKEVFAEFEKVY